MGWAGGSELFGEIIKVLRKEVRHERKRKAIYTKLIRAFEMHDWDTQDECRHADDMFDEALAELHPDWFEDEDDDY